MLIATASVSAWPVSQPTDVHIDGADLTKQAWMKEVDLQIERDDPFCLIVPFPCCPWNSLTYFDMSRFPEYAEHVEQVQVQHRPLLKWIRKKAEERIKKGRIVLLENPRQSRALHLDELARLHGMEDGLIEDATFEYVVGGQCEIGQADTESGLPYRARTL